ncbi:MAG: 50S ribosomal protein L25 [Bacillota bacterium]|nr:50S ribosomal protein L25 [Bacillota bacterium]
MNNLNAVKRDKKMVHSAKKERKKSMVPGILYGKQMQNIMFEIGALELTNEILRNGEHGILNINLDGQQHRTLVKEVQREPINRNVLHIDLMELRENDKLVAEVPIHLTGEESVRAKGGILQKEKSSVKVLCTPDKLPKSVNIDLANMNIGSAFKVSDVELGSEISIMDDPKGVILSVTNAGRGYVTGDNEGEIESPQDGNNIVKTP